jgi:hypothetical protein
MSSSDKSSGEHINELVEENTSRSLAIIYEAKQWNNNHQLCSTKSSKIVCVIILPKGGLTIRGA